MCVFHYFDPRPNDKHCIVTIMTTDTLEEEIGRTLLHDETRERSEIECESTMRRQCVTRAPSIHVVRPRQRRTGGDKSNAVGRAAGGGREMSSDVGPGEKITYPRLCPATPLTTKSPRIESTASFPLCSLDFLSRFPPRFLSMSLCLFLFIALSFYLPTPEYTFTSAPTPLLPQRYYVLHMRLYYLYDNVRVLYG